jgi:hypothetical protein
MNFYNNTHPHYCGIDLHARSLSVLAHKLGRCVYFMLKNESVFDETRFLKG